MKFPPCSPRMGPPYHASFPRWLGPFLTNKRIFRPLKEVFLHNRPYPLHCTTGSDPLVFCVSPTPSRFSPAIFLASPFQRGCGFPECPPPKYCNPPLPPEDLVFRFSTRLVFSDFDICYSLYRGHGCFANNQIPFLTP